MPRRLRLFTAVVLAVPVLSASPAGAGELGIEDVDPLDLELMIIRGEVEEAIDEAQRMLAGLRPSDEPLVLYRIGQVLTRLCEARGELGQYEPAEASCLEAVATLDQIVAPGLFEIEAMYEAQGRLAYTYERMTRYGAAITARRRQLELIDAGLRTADLRSSLLARIGDLHLARGERKEAEASYRHALDLTAHIPEAVRWTSLSAYRSLAAFYQQEERLDEAEAILDWALVEAQHLPNVRERQIIRFFEALASVFLQQGRFAEARDVAQQALDYYLREGEERSLEAAVATVLMARIEDAEAPGSPKAATLLSAVLEMPDAKWGPESGNIIRAVARIALAEQHLRRANFSTAEPLAREAFESLAGLHGDTHVQTARAQVPLAQALHGQGKHQEALPFALAAYVAQRQVLPPYHSETGETLALLIELYEALDRRKDLAAARELVEAHRAARAKFESSR